MHIAHNYYLVNQACKHGIDLHQATHTVHWLLGNHQICAHTYIA